MKISELKQPYRRMAEYLAERNTDEFKDVNILLKAFVWSSTNDLFWIEVEDGNYPEITEEIKTHFPADFDFSVEDVENINQKYTQLAKDGKFDELPDTCEFSEAVDLEVGDDNLSKDFRKITGKFKGNYMDVHCIGWNFAQLPTPKIDFSEFKAGDVVEVEYYGDDGNEKIVGYIYSINLSSFSISSKMTCYGEEEIILNQNIKSITKIK